MPRYNIAPTQTVAAIRSAQGGEGMEFIRLHWGLIPSWAKDAGIANKLINARSETLSEKPSFREAFKRKRCLIVADGFFEFMWTLPNSTSVLCHDPFRSSLTISVATL